MFNYFHQNKFRYNQKGQLTPIFIVVLVVLIIMALVTVNLSKVSFIKTDTSNAADAGSLAAGAVMANLFNAIGQANSEMEAAYWEFYATTSALFAIALGLLIAGLVQINMSLAYAAATAVTMAGCVGVCAAFYEGILAALAEAAGKNLLTQLYVAAVMSITISIIAYSIAAYFNYLLIRDMAEEGRENAIKTGHNFVFINSGIGSKLKDGKPPADISDDEAKRNYRDEFSKFLDKQIGANDEYTYSWKDGQGRSHYMKSKVSIDPVDTFKLKTTVLPWEAEVALLALGTTVIIAFLYSAGAALIKASCVCQSCCNNPWTAAVCCPCWYALCAAGMAMLKVGMAANYLAIAEYLAAWAALLIAWAGLLPGPVIRDSSGDAAWAFTICWIEDVVHNRKVKVDTWQYQEGADLGLWRTRYPGTPQTREIHSYSVVDFTGMGKIHATSSSDLRHDASIVATDVIGESQLSEDPDKLCPYVQSEVAALEREINESLNMADSYDRQADELEATVEALRASKAPANKIDEVLKNAEDARQMADDSRQHADDLEAEKARLQDEYAYCF